MTSSKTYDKHISDAVFVTSPSPPGRQAMAAAAAVAAILESLGNSLIHISINCAKCGLMVISTTVYRQNIPIFTIHTHTRLSRHTHKFESIERHWHRHRITSKIQAKMSGFSSLSACVWCQKTTINDDPKINIWIYFNPFGSPVWNGGVCVCDWAMIQFCIVFCIRWLSLFLDHLSSTWRYGNWKMCGIRSNRFLRESYTQSNFQKTKSVKTQWSSRCVVCGRIHRTSHIISIWVCDFDEFRETLKCIRQNLLRFSLGRQLYSAKVFICQWLAGSGGCTNVIPTTKSSRNLYSILFLISALSFHWLEWDLCSRSLNRSIRPTTMGNWLIGILWNRWVNPFRNPKTTTRIVVFDDNVIKQRTSAIDNNHNPIRMRLLSATPLHFGDSSRWKIAGSTVPLVRNALTNNYYEHWTHWTM